MEPEEVYAGTRHVTIQVPLGKSASASIFLVKGDSPATRLLRLKMWHTPAAPGFLPRFHRLQAQLESWAEEDIDPPLAASVDATGCPSVLTVFRQGIPILDRVRSGRLDRYEAIARLTPLIALTERAHALGLVHGSIVPGKVLVDPDSGRARLLDFGLNPLLASTEIDGALRAADYVGFASVVRTLRELPPNSAPPRQP
jgi:serine/threonine protein kinase